MKNLIFSFVVPAHNEENVIGPCIDSIKKQKNKEDYEIIVVNDGSTDKTGEIAKKMGARVIDFKTGHSAAFARNRGAEKANGKFLIFLDADQTLEKNFLEKLFSTAEKKDFNGGAFRILSTKPETIFQRGWHAYRKYNLCAAMIIKKKIFEKIKYREDLFYVEDDVLFEDFRRLGYDIKETGALVYHIDPKTFKDYLRQRKWQGRGLVMKIFKLKKYFAFRYFIPCIFLPLALVRVYIPAIYLLTFWIFFSIKSSEILNSFWWTITDFIGRFISLYFFLVYALAARIKGKFI